MMRDNTVPGATETEVALLGGRPLQAAAPWPSWPEIDEKTEESLLDAIRKRRWSVHWRSSEGGYSAERKFAQAFAEYSGVAHCVSVDHGSSALLIALEALDIGPLDEVVVPSVTWVAPATAVLRAGAVPMIADVDPITGCLTAQTIQSVLTTRTRAVLLVHLACVVADLEQITNLCRQNDIALIEDCSQAHGSRWAGKSVGTFGELGVFSFGASKALAGGEGGGVITNDDEMFRRLQELRADSRSYTTRPPRQDEFELVETATVMGANYCMSEFTAAILLDQLDKFDAQCQRRIAFVHALESQLNEFSAVDVVPILAQVDRRGFYELAFRIKDGSLSHLRTETVAAALTAELGVRFYPPRAPLFDSVFFQPQTKPRFHHNWDPARSLRRDYPGAGTYSTSTILLHHSALLADTGCASDIVTAFKKIEANSGFLAEAEANGTLTSAVYSGHTPTRLAGSA